MDQLAKDNGVRWLGHVLKKDKNTFVRRALGLKVRGTGKRRGPNKTWPKAVVEQSRKVGLNVSDANNRSRWRLGVNTISRMMRLIRTTPFFFFFFSFRLIPKKLMSSYTGMEECQKTNTNTKRKM